jgi:hypothetical protein
MGITGAEEKYPGDGMLPIGSKGRKRFSEEEVEVLRKS